LPTLENALPPMQDGNGDVLRLHEDDWRQIELIAADFEPEIAAELAAIDQVHAEREGMGFRRLHVRERIPEPLRGRDIRVDSLGHGPRRSLGFEDSPGVVSGGFAFDVDGGAIYGREEDGRVLVLGMWGADPEVLVDVARAHRLVIVAWCPAQMIRP
jgi:hypothetical protein